MGLYWINKHSYKPSKPDLHPISIDILITSNSLAITLATDLYQENQNLVLIAVESNGLCTPFSYAYN